MCVEACACACSCACGMCMVCGMCTRMYVACLLACACGIVACEMWHLHVHVHVHVHVRLRVHVHVSVSADERRSVDKKELLPTSRFEDKSKKREGAERGGAFGPFSLGVPSTDAVTPSPAVRGGSYVFGHKALGGDRAGRLTGAVFAFRTRVCFLQLSHAPGRHSRGRPVARSSRLSH